MKQTATPRSLLKGLEEEVYTGTPDGEVVGLSHRIVLDMPQYKREPDSRNVEYTTEPMRDYNELGCSLMSSRLCLREYLHQLGGYTLVPGSTLSLESASEFRRSQPENPYHAFIEENYGTRVVTTSCHINIGIEDPESLLRAWRVVRMEACLFLALTACSPFLDGQVTGQHSTRWNLFPLTPPNVPMFAGPRQYRQWVHQQLQAGTMQNTRHLWMSVRPNGPSAPEQLDRLELRICDRIDDPALLLGITAMLEARVWQILEDPDLDPLARAGVEAERLVETAAANDLCAAKGSLDAELVDWQSGQRIRAADWIRPYLDGVRPWARDRDFDEHLQAVDRVLADGNTAQRWLARYHAGEGIRGILRSATTEMSELEAEHQQRICS